MPRPSDAASRGPTDFAPLLATKDPVLLVGGQSVNLWALYYEARTAALAPFVSRDVDVLGDRETLDALGKIAGVKPQVFPLRPSTNEVGVVVAKDDSGQPLLIEVLRYLHGVTNEDLREPVYTMALGQTHVRVPGPIALIQAKIANVTDIAQTGRQDSRHVVILARLMPAYLSDLQAAAIEGRMKERKLVEFLERLLAVITTKAARNVFKALRLDARELFESLGDDSLPKLHAFLTKRVLRSLAG
jgi:hypothetical protein